MRNILKAFIFLCCVLLCSGAIVAEAEDSGQLYRPSWNERLFDAKIEAIKTRLNGMDKAIEVQALDIERRMLRLDGTKEINRLETRITVLETRIVTYSGVVIFLLLLTQVVFKIWTKEKRE